jgi:hypothetical protein
MGNKTLPKVQLTKDFRAFLEQSGQVADDFGDYFAEWKAADPVQQARDPYFGKDGPYTRPTRAGKPVLRHVHLRPQNTPREALAWDRQTKLGLTKTSDSVLIYAAHATEGYLLIHSVSDPGAHDFGNMTTAESAKLMEQFASLAEEFVFWGKVNC